MEIIPIEIKILCPERNINLPRYMTTHAAGMDVSACLDEPYSLNAGRIGLIPTGIALGIPDGYEIQVRPRSGLAIKHGIGVLNSPGTIDADYRGELKVIVFNFSETDFVIQHGDRIAQLVVAKVFHGQWLEVNELAATSRGEGGFGHTG